MTSISLGKPILMNQQPFNTHSQRIEQFKIEQIVPILIVGPPVMLILCVMFILDWAGARILVVISAVIGLFSVAFAKAMEEI